MTLARLDVLYRQNDQLCGSSRARYSSVPDRDSPIRSFRAIVLQKARTGFPRRSRSWSRPPRIALLPETLLLAPRVQRLKALEDGP
jgi:hypothetical protein